MLMDGRTSDLMTAHKDMLMIMGGKHKTAVVLAQSR